MGTWSWLSWFVEWPWGMLPNNKGDSCAKEFNVMILFFKKAWKLMGDLPIAYGVKWVLLRNQKAWDYVSAVNF